MEIRNSIKQGLDFVKKNPTIIYSLLLIVAVVAIILFNTYYSLGKFQKSVDELLHSKAILAEDIVQVFSRDIITNEALLNDKVREIKATDSEIKEITIAMPVENDEGFRIIASTEEAKIGQTGNDYLDRIAFFDDSGRALLASENKERFWDVAKVIKDAAGKRIGLVTLQLSLAEHDRFVQETISRVYGVSFVSLLIVLMLIANHARMFKYAVRVSKLEEIDRMKDDFISMASHELVSPLTAIRGYGELLTDNIRKENIASDNIFLYLKNIDSSAARLVTLVDDMLEVSRIEQNRLPIKLQKVDLGELIEKTVSEVRVNAVKKKLELVYEKKTVPEVVADPARVKQIVVNLLSNAIKYTPQGKVEVMIKEDGKYVAITVADTGLGISAEDLKNLFGKFYRIQNADTKNISGTGLGMWISRELARKMEGDLEVESIAGVGSHFTLKLPKV